MKSFYMIKRLLVMLALPACFLSAVSEVHARPLPPVQALEMLRRSFSGITDFTAEIIQEKQLSLMKKKMCATGVIRFKKPDTFYMELYSPYASRVLLKDTLLTQVFPAEGVRQRVVLPAEQSLKQWFSFLDHPVRSLPAGVDVNAETSGNVVTLRVIPKKKGSVKELRISFQESGKISKFLIEEQNRDRTVINFRNFRANVGLADKDFHLE